MEGIVNGMEADRVGAVHDGRNVGMNDGVGGETIADRGFRIADWLDGAGLVQQRT